MVCHMGCFSSVSALHLSSFAPITIIIIITASQGADIYKSFKTAALYEQSVLNPVTMNKMFQIKRLSELSKKHLGPRFSESVL